MATFDLDAMLASVSKPKSRRAALRDGDLVDTTRAAAWLGFRVDAAMTTATWEEIIGITSLRTTMKDRAEAGQRLRAVWEAASKAVASYRARGVVLPAIQFTHPAANARRQVTLCLRAGVESGRPYLTLSLEGE